MNNCKEDKFFQQTYKKSSTTQLLFDVWYWPGKKTDQEKNYFPTKRVNNVMHQKTNVWNTLLKDNREV